MSYSREIYDEAERVLRSRRLAAERKAQNLRLRFRQNPRVCELEAIMAGSVAKLSDLIRGGGRDYAAAFESIRSENLAAQEELASILAAAGETVRDFEPQYTCPHCSDTGYHDGKRCSCFQKLLRDTAAARLCALTGMTLHSFDELDLTFYSDEFDEVLGCSPREHMREIIAYCRHYGEHFSTDCPNLLLRGATGTGKTLVSLCIAAAACSREMNVIYGPVQVLLRQLEKEHFGREDGEAEETLTSCDLLILDDLGTEFSSPFYTSSLYAIINERLLGGRPTIISTNLDADAIYTHYGEQIASRLIGAYEPLLFVGQDVRQQKQQRRFQ